LNKARVLTLDSDVRRLAGTRPFDALPREAVQLLAFSCERGSLRAGERLFSRGDAADGAFFVLEGEIALKQPSAERLVGRGVLIGESALLTETVRPSDAVAALDSLVLRISRETFRRVLGEFPKSAAIVQRAAQARATELISRLEAVRRRRFSTSGGAHS
jgi:CRP-like cAMP-binding protein